MVGPKLSSGLINIGRWRSYRLRLIVPVALVERIDQVGLVPGDFLGDQVDQGRTVIGRGNAPVSLAQRKRHAQDVK